jgi:hypothetical protein
MRRIRHSWINTAPVHSKTSKISSPQNSRLFFFQGMLTPNETFGGNNKRGKLGFIRFYNSTGLRSGLAKVRFESCSVRQAFNLKMKLVHRRIYGLTVERALPSYPPLRKRCHRLLCCGSRRRAIAVVALIHWHSQQLAVCRSDESLVGISCAQLHYSRPV